MKANELRIGNWVNHKVDWSYRSENKKKPFYFQWNENDWNALGECALFLESVEPIPITEDWLVKFGFTKEKSSDFGDIELHKFISGSEYIVWYQDGSVAIGGSKEETFKGLCFCSNQIFQHIHQMQNLYFALTGEEL